MLLCDFILTNLGTSWCKSPRDSKDDMFSLAKQFTGIHFSAWILLKQIHSGKLVTSLNNANVILLHLSYEHVAESNNKWGFYTALLKSYM